MEICEACGAKTEGQYCDECAFYMQQLQDEALAEAHREEMRRWEYQEEMHRDAFGE